jgi:hypothetical protein
MSQKREKRVRRLFIPPPVESLSTLDFLWEDELLKEIKEHKRNNGNGNS